MELNVELNDQFIGIKKCCASCRLKCITSDGLRFCNGHKKYVYKTNLCEHWEMAAPLNKVGRSMGKIKDADYLKYVAKIRILEGQRIEAAEAKGMILKELKTKTIRKKYQQIHGEIIMKF